MKYLFNLITTLTIVILFSFTSCEKDEAAPEPNENIATEYSNKIILKDIELSESSAKLSWTKLDTSAFSEYIILRKNQKDEVFDPANIFYNPNIIKRIADPNVVTFTDENIPLATFVGYQVIGVLKANISSTKYIYSNNKNIERTDIKFIRMQLFDVLPDLSNNRLFTIESDSGRISIINTLSGTIEKTIKTNALVGYCALGTYNNTLELYVTRNDGWVYIYNAATLEKIDQISCGSPASSVVVNNNKLFVSTDDRSWPALPTKILNRTTKTLIGTAGDNADGGVPF